MTFQTIKESLLAHKLRSVIVLIVAGLVIFGIVKIANPKTTTASYTLGTVETGTIVSTVTGTGQVSSSNQIAVTAKSSGAITSLKVLPGQAVKKYQTIAVLDNKTARLNLDKARNDLKNAELDYANTKATQELSMQHQVISLNSSVSALPDIKNQDSVTPTISGSYNSTEQGRYTLKSYSCQTNSGICVDVSGIETDSVLVATNIPSSLGKRGLYITFSTLPKTNDVWTIDVPSPITNGYLSGSQNLTETSQQNAITLTAKQQSIENAKINLASAQSAYDDTIVTSPIDGQVGQLSVTEGQTINSGATVATLVTDKLFADCSPYRLAMMRATSPTSSVRMVMLVSSLK
jgi:multidrug resistance efflux pump